MTCLLILLTVLPTVLGADPTAMCAPPQIEYNVYSTIYDTTSFVAIDYNNFLTGIKGNNYRTVLDAKHNMSYSVDSQGGCIAVPLRPEDVYPQCLSANSTLVSSNTLGVGTHALPVQVWEVPSLMGVLRLTLQMYGDKTVPVMMEDARDQLLLYTDVNTSISDPLIFQVPDVCPPAPIV